MRWLAIAILCCAARVAAQPAPSAPAPTPWLGITYKPVPMAGWLVVEVHPDTPAAAGGLRAGDIVVGIDGAVAADLGEQIRARPIGARTRLFIERDGREQVVAVRLMPRPSPDELVHRALFGRALPRLRAVDPIGRIERPLRPGVAVVALFDARCATCAGVVNQVARALGPTAAPVRAVLLCDGSDEFRAALAVSPMAARAGRIERAVSAGLLGGLDVVDDGALVVTDGRGVVRYAAAISSDGVVDGAVVAVAKQIAAR